MNVYVDASVVIRVVFAEPEPLRSWGQIDQPVSSELVRIECLRAVERAQFLDRLDDAVVAERRANVLEIVDAIQLIVLERSVLERAGEAFPTSLGTLDAIHLASALAVRDQFEPLVFATHDKALALAARSVGFAIEGVAL